MRIWLIIFIIATTAAAVVAPGYLSAGKNALDLNTLANILILAATAIVVIFYTEETRRMAFATKEMADATKQMADATSTMAREQCRSDLVVEARWGQPAPGTGRTGIHQLHEVVNQGTGAAFDVTVRSEVLRPDVSWGCIPSGACKPLDFTPKGRPLTVSHRDQFDSYEQVWWPTESGWQLIADGAEPE